MKVMLTEPHTHTKTVRNTLHNIKTMHKQQTKQNLQQQQKKRMNERGASTSEHNNCSIISSGAATTAMHGRQWRIRVHRR